MTDAVLPGVATHGPGCVSKHMRVSHARGGGKPHGVRADPARAKSLAAACNHDRFFSL